MITIQVQFKFNSNSFNSNSIQIQIQFKFNSNSIQFKFNLIKTNFKLAESELSTVSLWLVIILMAITLVSIYVKMAIFVLYHHPATKFPNSDSANLKLVF